LFDTIKLHVDLCLTEEEIDNINWNTTNSSEDHVILSGERIFKTYYKGDSEPRLLYRYNNRDNKHSLKIEVSVPKFMYGNNVMEVKQGDIPVFLNKLRSYVAAALCVPITRVPDLAFAEVEKLHVCANFQVGDKKLEYLRALFNVERGAYELYTYRDLTTISWKATTRTEKFYDKEEELLYAKRKKHISVDPKVLELAKGILRYEIELSDKDMRQRSPMRWAGELLDSEFALKHLRKGLDDLGVRNLSIPFYQELMTVISGDKELNIQSRTNLISFICQRLFLSDAHCREYYSKSTYYRLKNLLRNRYGVSNIVLEGNVPLPALVLKQDKFSAASPFLHRSVNYSNRWYDKKISSIQTDLIPNTTFHDDIWKWTRDTGKELSALRLNNKRLDRKLSRLVTAN
jgi:hypothetical protein